MLFLESKLKVSVFLSNELLAPTSFPGSSPTNPGNEVVLAQDQLDLHKYMKGRKYNVTVNCKLGVNLIKLLQV